MRWIVILGVLGMLGACGGTQIPVHAGYRNDKVKLWKKPKTLKFDEKMEAKSEGDLSYAEFRRAKWFAIDVPSHGNLTLKLEITPPGDSANEDFDLALEVLDPGFRVIGKSDLEEEDAGELTKNKTLLELEPGRYLVHLYLQSRMDTADYILRASFQATKPAELKSDFPSQVAFVPSLPMVPLTDDTPPGRIKQPPKGPRRPPRPPKPPPDPTKPVPTILSARIIGVSVVSGGTRITVGRGISTGATSGMKAKLNGISGAFPIECNDNTCAATISATPDQVRGAGGSVTLIP
jgi:hypothetical protein